MFFKVALLTDLVGHWRFIIGVKKDIKYRKVRLKRQLFHYDYGCIEVYSI